MKFLLLSIKKTLGMHFENEHYMPRRREFLRRFFSPKLILLADSVPELKKKSTFSRKLSGRFVKTAFKVEKHFEENCFSSKKIVFFSISAP